MRQISIWWLSTISAYRMNPAHDLMWQETLDVILSEIFKSQFYIRWGKLSNKTSITYVDFSVKIRANKRYFDRIWWLLVSEVGVEHRRKHQSCPHEHLLPKFKSSTANRLITGA